MMIRDASDNESRLRECGSAGGKVGEGEMGGCGQVSGG